MHPRGAEVAGEVVVKARALNVKMPTPCVETKDTLAIIASAKSLDQCEKMVLDKTHAFLVKEVGYTANKAAMLMSLACDLEVCQVVDPLKTMRLQIPKFILKGWEKKLAKHI